MTQKTFQSNILSPFSVSKEWPWTYYYLCYGKVLVLSTEFLIILIFYREQRTYKSFSWRIHKGRQRIEHLAISQKNASEKGILLVFDLHPAWSKNGLIIWFFSRWRIINTFFNRQHQSFLNKTVILHFTSDPRVTERTPLGLDKSHSWRSSGYTLNNNNRTNKPCSLPRHHLTLNLTKIGVEAMAELSCISCVSPP